MTRYELKLVPNDNPNADGFWVEADVDIESAAAAGKTGFRVFEDASPLPDHHVVDAVPFRGGEPMYCSPETRERDRLAYLRALERCQALKADTADEAEVMSLQHSLPTPDNARAKGWTHQVDWTYHGSPCFHRAKSREEAEAWAKDNEVLCGALHRIRAIPWEVA